MTQIIKNAFRNDVTEIHIADFSTLYTKLEFQTIMTNVTRILDILFKNCGMKWLKVTSNGMHMHYNNDRTATSFTKEDIVELLHIVIDNSYVKFAGNLFKQITGLPMGSSPAPIIADLVLSYCEFNYLRHPANKANAIRLKYTKRYVDDICSIGTSALKEVYAKIYPATLPLNFDNTGNGRGHFLDMYIDLQTKTIALYDKRRDYTFKVIRFGHVSSNQPECTGYSTLYSQIIRYANTITADTIFIDECRILIETFRLNGYNDGGIIKSIKKLFKNYPLLLTKYKITSAKQFISYILK